MKKAVAILLAVVFALSAAACGASQTAAPTQTKAPANTTTGDTTTKTETPAENTPVEKTLLKFNFTKTSTDPNYDMWCQFAEKLGEASEGTIEMEVYTSEALGATKDVVEMISQGAYMVADIDGSFLQDYVADYGLYMYPYLLEKPEDIYTVWNSDWGRNLDEQLRAHGLHLMVNTYFGTRNLITSKPVNSRADLKSLTIRFANTKMYNAIGNTVFGSSVTNTAWSETYMALSQGVADGADPPFHLMYSAKLYEVCKYVALTEHVVTGTILVMSEDVYNSLPEAGKKAIDEWARDYAENVMCEQAYSVEQSFRANLEENGVTVTEVDKTPFMEAAKEMMSEFPEFSEGAYDLIKGLIS